MSTNRIGIEESKAQGLADQLNELLAHYQIFYMNVRGYHWNIKGDKFFELHTKFEELYTDLLLKVDEIAERILTLGYRPIHAYSEYMNLSRIPERTNVTDGHQCVKEILDGLSVLIKLERDILEASGEASDEGTNSLMSDYITEQEKTAWMYSSFLGE
ncbi:MULTISPECIES: Dps family protein [Gammaproteobacteria]|jgi:starvation-inducible DNA-binding protein|uniref:DNA starvation/stationary phase protection protein n=1 Tax=Vreelandella halophila TaxID=86177 RepID=A0A9X4YBN3_9GAMM|nr:MULTISPECIES: Dps family protein [Gammaproteobacteria]KAA8984509.1 DNA starvation/stationary phase protection protein [Halospina sp. K52047b]MYL26732.1 DNA starvation/stationary phase protection protein [Halomonas utahensis]MYL75549.1 DNA starvation/stationary phase protection protein [Halomonas sp. 22501_18_FS]